MRSMNATSFAVILLLCLAGAKAKRGLLQKEASAPAPDVSVSGAAPESAPTGFQAPTTVLSASVPTAGPAGDPGSSVAIPQSAPAAVALPAPAEGPPALGAIVAPAPSNAATASVTAAPSQLVSACARAFSCLPCKMAQSLHACHPAIKFALMKACHRRQVTCLVQPWQVAVEPAACTTHSCFSWTMIFRVDHVLQLNYRTLLTWHSCLAACSRSCSQCSQWSSGSCPFCCHNWIWSYTYRANHSAISQHAGTSSCSCLCPHASTPVCPCSSTSGRAHTYHSPCL